MSGGGEQRPGSGTPSERRAFRVFYPVSYPTKLVPAVIVHPDRAAELLDWSEMGVRVRLFGSDSQEAEVGETLALSITPPGGETIFTTGHVVRVDQQGIAMDLQLAKIPWKIILAEQLAIAKWKSTRVEQD